MSTPRLRRICPKCGSVACQRLPGGEGLECTRCGYAARTFPTSPDQPCSAEWDGRPRSFGRVLPTEVD